MIQTTLIYLRSTVGWNGLFELSIHGTCYFSTATPCHGMEGLPEPAAQLNALYSRLKKDGLSTGVCLKGPRDNGISYGDNSSELFRHRNNIPSGMENSVQPTRVHNGCLMLLELIEHYNLLVEQMRIYDADKMPTRSIWLFKIRFSGYGIESARFPSEKAGESPGRYQN